MLCIMQYAYEHTQSLYYFFKIYNPRNGNAIEAHLNKYRVLLPSTYYCLCSAVCGISCCLYLYILCICVFVYPTPCVCVCGLRIPRRIHHADTIYCRRIQYYICTTRRPHEPWHMPLVCFFPFSLTFRAKFIVFGWCTTSLCRLCCTSYSYIHLHYTHAYSYTYTYTFHNPNTTRNGVGAIRQLHAPECQYYIFSLQKPTRLALARYTRHTCLGEESVIDDQRIDKREKLFGV